MKLLPLDYCFLNFFEHRLALLNFALQLRRFLPPTATFTLWINCFSWLFLKTGGFSKRTFLANSMLASSCSSTRSRLSCDIFWLMLVVLHTTYCPTDARSSSDCSCIISNEPAVPVPVAIVNSANARVVAVN